MIFTTISIIVLVVYICTLVCTFIYAKQGKRVTEDSINLLDVMRYVNSIMLITLFTSFILALQETKVSHPISTFHDAGFITDLVTISFILSIVLVYNLRILRHFSQPIIKDEYIDSLDKFILYLRSFKDDNSLYGKIIKRISKKTFGAISIANPHEILQNVDGDKIFTDDISWQTIVDKCLQKAKFVILHIGKTDGCLWELEKCVGKYIGKTVFFISSQKNYDLFVKYICEVTGCSCFIFPKYTAGKIQVYFLLNPMDLKSWTTMEIIDKNSITKFIDLFTYNRLQLKCEIDEWVKVRKQPLLNLFNKKVFPEKFNMLSWCGLSPFSYPFLARLNWQFWIIGTILFLLLTVFGGSVGILIFAIILTILGKRMMYLSYNWTGEHAVNSQINFMALMILLSSVISYILGFIYLQIYPITNPWYY